MLVWVIGAGGLIGSAIVRKAEERGDTVLVSTGVPWHDTEQSEAHLRHDRDRFATRVDQAPSMQGWAIVWCAGAATTASAAAEFTHESRAFERFMTMISEGLPRASRGRVLVVSSAGGVYAGSSPAPFSASTTPSPIGAYGRLKAEQEDVACRILSPHADVIIARISNLYGPGQDLSKLQGVISQLCSAGITKQPVSIFVSLDTLRDFIYVDDAAQLALHWLYAGGLGITTRVIASGTSTSLGRIITLVNDVVRSRVPIAYGLHASASAQSRDMRLTPDSDSVTEMFSYTSLPVGIRAVYLDLLERHAVGRQPLATSLG